MKKLSIDALKKITGGKKWSAWQCFLTSISCSSTWDGNTCAAYQKHCH